MIRKALFSLFVGLVAAIAGAQADFVKDQVLVKFNSGASFIKSVSIESIGGTIAKEIPDLGWTVVKLGDGVSVQGAIDHFKSFGAVRYVEPNYIFKALFTPNDTQYGNQYAPKKIKADLAWDLTKGSATVVIAVIDTGVQLNHPDLQSKLVQGHDFSDNDDDPSDEMGHGTHCAGNAAAATNNSVGIAGIGFNCKIMPLKIFPNSTADNLALAMHYAADHGAKVISMSVGSYADSKVVSDGVDYAAGKGLVLVAAAGNDNTSQKLYPAGYDKCIAVGATDINDKKADFSNFGDWVDVASPGVNILSTFLGSGYASESGTSMSTPEVAGVAALVFSQGGPSVTAAQVRNAIESTCDPVGNWVVHGRVNAFEAVKKIQPPVEVDFPATSISMYYGGVTSGDLSSVALSDDIRYEITSQYSNIGPAAGAYVTLNINQSLNNLTSLKLILEGRAINTSTNMFWLYNWNTGQYDFYKSFAFGASDSVLTMTIGSFANYISSNGDVKIITRVSRGQRVRPILNFIYGIDQVKLRAGFKQ